MWNVRCKDNVRSLGADTLHRISVHDSCTGLSGTAFMVTRARSPSGTAFMVTRTSTSIGHGEDDAYEATMYIGRRVEQHSYTSAYGTERSQLAKPLGLARRNGRRQLEQASYNIDLQGQYLCHKFAIFKHTAPPLQATALGTYIHSPLELNIQPLPLVLETYTTFISRYLNIQPLPSRT
ncbi:hypothetical protein Bbelb_349620 [Branchiostoma belcheri]|nr:hypothetical protein Bbelb_349620 [Branchiostoma belcheri]